MGSSICSCDKKQVISLKQGEAILVLNIFYVYLIKGYIRQFRW